MGERNWTAEPWVATCQGPDDPWFLMADGFDQCPAYIARADTDEQLIPYAEQRANMERAAACVNALAGVSDPAGLRKQRDDLLAALQDIVDGLERAGHASEHCHGGTCHYCAVRRKVWAAIAKASD